MWLKTSFLSGLLMTLSVSPLSAEIIEVFATGVDPKDASTYNNVQQGWRPTCWAASGSNVIGHWQQYHAPESNAPQSAQEVYDSYIGIFSNHTGGRPETLYQWWLGHHSAAILGGYDPVEPNYSQSGGYYTDVYATINDVKEVAWAYTSSFSGTSPTGEYEGFLTTSLSRAIYYALEQGYAMAINVPNDSHALTIYGASFDTETNLLTSVWLCDSSGYSFDKKEISEVVVGVRTGADGDEYLSLLGYNNGMDYDDSYDRGKYIGNAYFLGNSLADTVNFVYSIPEPSAFGLLAGLGALALVASRRRRK